MKESFINRQRAVVAHDQLTEIAKPGEGAFDGPAPLVASQRPAILRRGLVPILAMESDQLDASLRQSLAQRVTVIATVRNDTNGLLSGTTLLAPPYPDRRQRRFRQPDFRGGRRVKVVSQRNTRAVNHHHPLRPLAPLGFPDSQTPFFAGAKLPSRNASLHFNCWCSFNSARNARQIFNQTPCSSESRSSSQHVAGDGNSSGKSCQRAPLRRIHKMPSSTLRSSARGRPPRGRFGFPGSRGRIFSHWESANNRPYRAIRPPPGAAYLHQSLPMGKNYCNIRQL